MLTNDISRCLTTLFSELVNGAKTGGAAFILNSGDAGLLRSLDQLDADDASRAMQGGATIAAHAQHVQYGLSLMNRWATEGGNPFADARWDDAWKTSFVDDAQWAGIRADLRAECDRWLASLGTPREVSSIELTGLISSIAHLAYHFGAIRQIAPAARGPREGTYA
jgi:hypothetical protein